MDELPVEHLPARLDELVQNLENAVTHPVVITQDGKPVAVFIDGMDFLYFQDLQAGRDGLLEDTEEAIAEAEAQGFGTRQSFIDQVLRQHPNLAPDPQP